MVLICWRLYYTEPGISLRFSGLASFLPVMEESIQNLSDVLGKIAVFALVILFMINFAVLMGSRIRLEKSTRQNNNPEL